MTWLRSEQVDVTVSCDFGNRRHDIHAATLLAALERAVLAVAGES